MIRYPFAKPRFRRHANPQGYTFEQVAKLRQFPTGLTGKGITVGYMTLGGSLNLDYLSNFLGFKPKVNILQGPGSDMTPDPQGADVENYLDAIGILSIAPEVTLNVYSAGNSLQGMQAIVQQAVNDGVHLSQSWGSPEDPQSVQALEPLYQQGYAKNLLFTAAAGDNGANDNTGRPITDYPSCSAYNLACGGTRIGNPDTVWNDGRQGGATGGGVSKLVSMPSWQASVVHSPWRNTPDLALNADPQTGYISLDGYGNQTVVGGTSAVAPMMMGLWALLLEANGGKPIPNPLAWIYALGSSAFTDITIGNNSGYNAGPGWDNCTGLGEPIGNIWLQAIKGGVQPPPVNPPPPSQPTGVVTPDQVQQCFEQVKAQDHGFGRAAVGFAESQVMPLVQQAAGVG